MLKKLTTTIDEEVYKGHHSVVGRARISRFLEDLARPHLVTRDLDPFSRAWVWPGLSGLMGFTIDDRHTADGDEASSPNSP